MPQQISSIIPPKNFGFWTASCLVIGNMIGSGIFLIPATLALIGPISVFGWIVTAIGAISLAYIFATLSHHNPAAGGPFIYTRHAFGDFAGFLMAWGYWGMAWTSNGAICLAFTSYLCHFFPWIGTQSLAIFVTAASVLWITTLINCLGLRYGGFVQVLTVIIKITPLVLVGVVGSFHFDLNLLVPLSYNDQSLITNTISAAAITMWAFLGLEAATVPAENVKNADKIIPKATIFGTSVSAVLYIGITIVLFGLVPGTELARSPAPFMLAATKLFGDIAALYVGICILISVFGGLNGWILVQGQIPLVLAQEGLLSKYFAHTSNDGTPVFGLVFSSILTTIMLAFCRDITLTTQFEVLILVGAVSTLISYGMAALSALKLLKVFENPKKYIALIGAVIISLIYVLGAIIGSGLLVVLICMGGYALGVPVFLYYRHRQLRAVIP